MYSEISFTMLTASLLHFTFYLYLFSFVAYVAVLVSKKNFYTILATTFTIVAFTLHSLDLLFRWFAIGIDHPHLDNTYETISFFIWSIVLVHLLLIKRHKIHLNGILVMTIVTIGMGLAALHPASQSHWLHSHVLHIFMSGISYACSFIAASFAFLLIIKTQKIFPIISLALDSFSFLCLTLALSYIISSSATIDIWSYGILVVLYVTTLSLHIADIISKKSLNSKIAQIFSLSTFAIYSSWMILLLMSYLGIGENFPSISPYKLGLAVFGLLISLIHHLIVFRYERFIEMLPPENTLDRLSYNSILVSFSLLSLILVIVTASTWKWDAKEHWSLITWLIYAIYLYLRLQNGWRGQRLAIIALLGFFSVIFTCIGK
ncbi:MAG: cytochrome c biogenesis protein CcsA [Oligoflexia bacterium]|nr:cytochrome c biogenesis protein CcsA [Oligoflexia bacterium]